MQVKKKVAIFLGIWLFLILALLLFIYKRHEARKAEVAANCRALIDKENPQEREKAILEQYPRGKTPPIVVSKFLPYSPKITEIDAWLIIIKISSWNEVGINDDLPFATNGYTVRIDWKNGGGILEMGSVFIASPNDCDLQIWSGIPLKAR